jgi:hypothetical protein
MNWSVFKRGQAVKFYTADGWKKGTVTHVNPNSCSVLWYVGSTQKTTTVYDTRNIKPI